MKPPIISLDDFSCSPVLDFVDQLIDRQLIYLLIDQSNEWLIDLCIEWLVNQSFDCLLNYLFNWLITWFIIDWFISAVSWLTD